MSDFHNVVNDFDNLIKKYNFKCPKKLWYNELVALTKHLEDDFYCYIIARIHKNNGALETTLWVGPIDRPDDGLDSLSAHIEIKIDYSQMLDKNFFLNCQKKITNIIESGVLESLVYASKKELINPSILNTRYDVYTSYIIPFYHLVLESINYDKSILKDKKKCQPFIEALYNNITNDDMKSFFNRIGLKETINMIWDFCYLYSM
ncbi:Imm25 family immunity protein [Myroides albus]|uniref:Imm25 family immunity protein n=1 Tax=Myroides albus TaxID=2562892 RepID=UPI00215990F8|nr:Imm25 family immunity protein [Myroides albus]UVD80144.1 Imm25 family immunity protein [Myroides albus]